MNPARARYLAAITELADVIVEIPLNDLPPYHRDLQAAINQRNPDVQQALSAHANSEFLDSILDLKGIDEQRFPRDRWEGSEKPGLYWKGCSARQQRVLQRAHGEEQDARCRFPNCDCAKLSEDEKKEWERLHAECMAYREEWVRRLAKRKSVAADDAKGATR